MEVAVHMGHIFHKEFMSSWFESCENSLCFDCNFNHPKSLIRTCHGSWAAVTCAKLWPDLIIIFLVRLSDMFVFHFNLFNRIHRVLCYRMAFHSVTEIWMFNSFQYIWFHVWIIPSLHLFCHCCRQVGTCIYHKTSSTSRTKSQSLNVSCILVQLSSLNPLKPGVKLRMKM